MKHMKKIMVFALIVCSSIVHLEAEESYFARTQNSTEKRKLHNDTRQYAIDGMIGCKKTDDPYDYFLCKKALLTFQARQTASKMRDDLSDDLSKDDRTKYLSRFLGKTNKVEEVVRLMDIVKDLAIPSQHPLSKCLGLAHPKPNSSLTLAFRPVNHYCAYTVLSKEKIDVMKELPGAQISFSLEAEGDDVYSAGLSRWSGCRPLDAHETVGRFIYCNEKNIIASISDVSSEK